MEVEMQSGVDTEEVRWERFLPRRVLRVMVVEPDDSTRNVISALLSKCSYKVISVSDGLEAWEALKENPPSIDLILTEVDLPSISGFTLLSLVMEHLICRRIPVIMMLSKDTLSTVLKCMLKGAADFLIKPIRKNELRNIWQHVWRSQLSATDHKSASNSEECLKISSTSVKTAVTSPLNADISSEQEETEFKEMKVITKVEDEEPPEIMKTKNNPAKECVKVDKGSGSRGRIREFGQEMLCSRTQNSAAPGDLEDGAIAKRAKLCDSDGPKLQGEGSSGDIERRDVLFRGSPSLAAIDMIGSFGAGKGASETSKFIVGNFNLACGTQLELSLHGSNVSNHSKKETDGGHILNHSSASAFSRYKSGNKLDAHSGQTLSQSTCNTGKLGSAELQKITSAEVLCGGPNRLDTLRSSEREAALMKFREKRKARCFEKKVRYHSRKQLAEQRPRVKGQFVRQMQMDSASTAS